MLVILWIPSRVASHRLCNIRKKSNFCLSRMFVYPEHFFYPGNDTFAPFQFIIIFRIRIRVNQHQLIQLQYADLKKLEDFPVIMTSNKGSIHPKHCTMNHFSTHSDISALAHCNTTFLLAACSALSIIL